MIDLPIGKAIVAIENNNCTGCIWEVKFDLSYLQCVCGEVELECSEVFSCQSYSRKDGKNVIFKIVDYPGLPEK